MINVQNFIHQAKIWKLADQTQFPDGYAVIKYRNLTRDGSHGSSLDFADVDFPIFRLPEMYLIYDEAYLRGGGGDGETALTYFNNIRTRANAQTFLQLISTCFLMKGQGNCIGKGSEEQTLYAMEDLPTELICGHGKEVLQVVKQLRILGIYTLYPQATYRQILT